jgi:hypothetical protein
MKAKETMTPEQPITDRAEINRANSQLSTGPKTEAGKQRSSLNALRHGLTSQIVVIPTEDQQVYQLHLKSFTDEYDPQGVTESHLVQAVADTAWRLNRVAVLETNLLTLAAANPLDDAPALVMSLESQTKALANLSLHSQRLSRQFERTVAQLRDLQQTRRTQEKKDLDNLLNVMEMYKAKGETYRPSDDGFVFSQTQINLGLITRKRERVIKKASDYVYHNSK